VHPHQPVPDHWAHRAQRGPAEEDPRQPRLEVGRWERCVVVPQVPDQADAVDYTRIRIGRSNDPLSSNLRISFCVERFASRSHATAHAE
jgi:hypothetical protein